MPLLQSFGLRFGSGARFGCHFGPVSKATVRSCHGGILAVRASASGVQGHGSSITSRCPFSSSSSPFNGGTGQGIGAGFWRGRVEREFGRCQSSIGVRLWSSLSSERLARSRNVREMFGWNVWTRDADDYDEGSSEWLRSSTELPLHVWSMASRSDLELTGIRDYVCTLESKVTLNEETIAQQERCISNLQCTETALRSERDELCRDRWQKEHKIRELEAQMERSNDTVDHLWGELQKSKETIRQKTGELFILKDQLEQLDEQLRSLKAGSMPNSPATNASYLESMALPSQKDESQTAIRSLESSEGRRIAESYGCIGSKETSFERERSPPQFGPCSLASQAGLSPSTSVGMSPRAIGEGPTVAPRPNGTANIFLPSPFTEASMPFAFTPLR